MLAIHPNWLNKLYWMRIKRWIEIGFTPKPQRRNPLWVWPDDAEKGWG